MSIIHFRTLLNSFRVKPAVILIGIKIAGCFEKVKRPLRSPLLPHSFYWDEEDLFLLYLILISIYAILNTKQQLQMHIVIAIK